MTAIQLNRGSSKTFGVNCVLRDNSVDPPTSTQVDMTGATITAQLYGAADRLLSELDADFTDITHGVAEVIMTEEQSFLRPIGISYVTFTIRKDGGSKRYGPVKMKATV